MMLPKPSDILGDSPLGNHRNIPRKSTRERGLIAPFRQIRGNKARAKVHLFSGYCTRTNFMIRPATFQSCT